VLLTLLVEFPPDGPLLDFKGPSVFFSWEAVETTEITFDSAFFSLGLLIVNSCSFSPIPIANFLGIEKLTVNVDRCKLQIVRVKPGFLFVNSEVLQLSLQLMHFLLSLDHNLKK